jgi:ribonuclease E
MLIDATHPEETRVVVLRGNRVEEFDFESAARKQLRGNIYLAKVTRVEPSLQAAFVDYGGNRHGFLAFSEIHPDYYQIPVADRQALIDEESRAHRAADEEVDHRGGRRRRRRGRGAERAREVVHGEPLPAEQLQAEELAREAAEIPAGEDVVGGDLHGIETAPVVESPSETGAAGDFSAAEAEQPAAGEAPQEAAEAARYEAGNEAELGSEAVPGGEDGNGEEESVESVGGDEAQDEAQDRVRRVRRHYKIQEVIKRRQIMLVQVVKEERGTKGAALTTYLSLAGRYSVLMPNTARGGGISRKITSAEDRNHLKEIADALAVPEGMGVILRTAGANRTKTEIQRDFEYLLRLWETVRDLTLKSTAPKLVYEEGSLVKRSIRDLYNEDIDEIVVAGEAGYNDAKDFMRMLMPSHAKNVKLYRDTQPIFTRYGIEPQLDAMFQPTVQLKSGGYIVLNQAEALVAIDVNSGRATREHSIEETALKTNTEAAAEIARQLRLRDLAGLIVIDFIDMDEKRNNRAVERRLKEALKSDRARIQVGHISHFGLLEMSRQRMRTSVLESSTEICPHCGGTGHVRSVSSVALQLLRAIEDTLLKSGTHNLVVRARSDVALYVLNNKRAHLRALEERFRILIAINADAGMTGQPPFSIERGEQVMTPEQAKAVAAQAESAIPPLLPEEPEAELIEAEAAAGEIAEPEAAPQGEREGRGRRRRRGRRGGRGRGRGGEPREPASFTHETVAEHAVTREEDFEPLPEGEAGEAAATGVTAEAPPLEALAEEPRGEGERKRRRGRRGGRRRRGREGEPAPTVAEETGGEAAAPEGPVSFEPQEGREAPPPTIEQAPAPAARETAAPEAPRRRSTVREPVSFYAAGGETPPPAPPVTTPAPEPATPETAEDEPTKPRRTGWWARRG